MKIQQWVESRTGRIGQGAWQTLQREPRPDEIEAAEIVSAGGAFLVVGGEPLKTFHGPAHAQIYRIVADG